MNKGASRMDNRPVTARILTIELKIASTAFFLFSHLIHNTGANIRSEDAAGKSLEDVVKLFLNTNNKNWYDVYTRTRTHIHTCTYRDQDNSSFLVPLSRPSKSRARSHSRSAKDNRHAHGFTPVHGACWYVVTHTPHTTHTQERKLQPLHTQTHTQTYAHAHVFVPHVYAHATPTSLYTGTASLIVLNCLRQEEEKWMLEDTWI